MAQSKQSGFSAWTWAFIGLAALYLLSPIDLVPDLVPILGWVDDVLIGVVTLWMLNRARQRRAANGQWAGGEQSSSRQRQREPSSGAADAAKLDPWQVLQTSRHASPDELAAAYKAQLLRYHPDRVAHLGEEFQRLAHQRTLEIQQAYARLKRQSA